MFPRIVFVFLMWISLPAMAQSQNILRLATTTSTDNSGLLAAIVPAFEAKSGYQLQVVAVGTGKALRLGEQGDVDVLLVHAPADEVRFVEAGFGVNRRSVMYNDFVLVGPVDDPAQARSATGSAHAFARIAARQAVFVSRGDNSGTHKQEQAIWKTAQVAPGGRWYREAGQGMGKVLQMADQFDGYALTDRGTWIAFQGKLKGLRVAHEGDPDLRNPYSVIAVNPARYSDINYAGAMRFIAFLTSPQGQRLIGDFRIGGARLFQPTAVPE